MRLWGALRSRLRDTFFRFLRKVAETDDARAIQVASLRDVLPSRPEIALGDPAGLPPQPYADLGAAPGTPRTAERTDIVIISARFRSGSTLLWNLFRAIDGCTAYYEPFNERRWFDPTSRGEQTDATHKGVTEYWREYEGLQELDNHYREAWIGHNLFMDKDVWDPAMKRYVEVLVERAPGRPVLQFNRIDFRLPWFRHHFPRAKIVHLYRHPRDQWISSLVDPAEYPRDATMTEFANHDHYYLRLWAGDLKYHFPFLAESCCSHAYEMFYFLWKLSYLYGRKYAHVSVCYEDLLREPEKRLAELFDKLAMPGNDLAGLAKLVEKPRSGRWQSYAGVDWFQNHEAHCEAVMEDFFRTMPQ
ncbi:MAG: sulfotransferase [Gemmataceae bacterium]|nr:sulfotransferase [Gemmataceae bacterium]